MNPSLFRKAVPHLIAIGVFIVVAVIYCKPALEGKVLNQSDVLGHTAMAKQSFNFNEKYGRFPLWTESMFGGMPTYNIQMYSPSVIVNHLHPLFTLFLPKPISYFFLACICFYLLTQVIRINPYIGILGALAYGYSTFDPIIVTVGHDTQMLALGYAPAVVSGLLVIFQRKYIAGAAMLCIFFGLQLSITQHLQVVYYTIMVLGAVTIAFFIKCLREKQLKQAAMGIAVAIAAGLIGFGTYAVALLPVQEYATETMRGGKSELGGTGSNKTKGGLDKDYAFTWSYGISETLTLFVPGVYGGGNVGKEFTDNSKFAERLEEGFGLPEASAVQNANVAAYWGDQGGSLGTAGPVYLGAVIIFLFIFALFYVNSWHKWWIIGISIFAIFLAWGRNFAGFNYFLFDHMPFYSKFRSPTMALIIPQLTFPLLAALGLDQLFKDNAAKSTIWPTFKKSVIASAALILLAVLFYFSASFKAPNDSSLRENLVNANTQQLARGAQPTPQIQQQASEVSNTMLKALQEDRQSLFFSDLIRSFILVTLAGVLVGLYLKDKIKPLVCIFALLALSSFDLLAEGRKYLNEDNFVEPTDIDAAFAATAADRQISSDPDQNFRVFDETDQSGPFNSSRASYYHNSIGGYHPAKLGLYQDIIENQLSKMNLNVFNMLNTRYFIQRNPANGQGEARLNTGAYGPCWLVKNIHYVNNATEEMKALDSINTRDTAIVRKIYQGQIKFEPVADTTASIKLLQNLNDKINYKFSSKTNQFAVFSEVYYEKGWNAFIDGNKADYVKVDYVLRGMAIPAGDHTIEFRFEPSSFKTGEKISWISSLLAYVLLGLAIWTAWKSNGKKAKTVTGAA